jgi:hypothetical protein
MLNPRLAYKPHPRGHGALLLMVLIALAIILFMAFGSVGGGKSYTQQISQTRKQGVQMARELETRQLTILIAQYRVENNGKLPKSAADMDNESAFLDPWRNPLVFTYETPRNGPTKVIFRSAGPDGQANTEDDLVKEDTLPF